MKRSPARWNELKRLARLAGALAGPGDVTAPTGIGASKRLKRFSSVVSALDQRQARIRLTLGLDGLHGRRSKIRLKCPDGDLVPECRNGSDYDKLEDESFRGTDFMILSFKAKPGGESPDSFEMNLLWTGPYPRLFDSQFELAFFPRDGRLEAENISPLSGSTILWRLEQHERRTLRSGITYVFNGTFETVKGGTVPGILDLTTPPLEQLSKALSQEGE